MAASVLGLFGVALAAALAELLLPSEEGRATKIALRFLVSLSVLLLFLAPFRGILSDAPPFSLDQIIEAGESAVGKEGFDAIFRDAINEGSAQALKEGLSALLAEQYGIGEGQAQIFVYFDGKGELSRVQIYLSGSALLKDPHELEAELGALLGCETEVR